MKVKLPSIKDIMKQYPYLLTYSHSSLKKILDIYILRILNNANFSNQHWESLPKYRPAWTICSQHSDYHHSGSLHDVL